MKIKFINQNNNIFAFFLYLTLIFGFLIGENFMKTDNAGQSASDFISELSK